MNERIKQLATQAGFQSYITTHEEDVAMFEKFAELIVKECAQAIKEKGTESIDFDPSRTGIRPEYWDMAQHIKQHFGVEE